MPRRSQKRAEKTLKKLRPLQRALLKGNPKRTKQITEFVDKDHSVSEDFYDITEAYQGGVPIPETVIADMMPLIVADPDFLDPYQYVAEAYYELDDVDSYSKYVFTAYLKALNAVATKDGHYPKELLWGWLENRHIIRALSTYALLQWDSSDERLALEIYRKLLASNPHDNSGARFQILALRMGYLSDYEELFTPKTTPAWGLDATKLSEWFEANAQHYPEEFDEWRALQQE